MFEGKLLNTSNYAEHGLITGWKFAPHYTNRHRLYRIKSETSYCTRAVSIASFSGGAAAAPSHEQQSLLRSGPNGAGKKHSSQTYCRSGVAVPRLRFKRATYSDSRHVTAFGWAYLPFADHKSGHSSKGNRYNL